jgi:DNA-binding response OmpR family regulator
MIEKNRLSNIRVLVVDDEKLSLKLTHDVLYKLGFSEVYTAHSGRDAIHVLLDRNVDLVITDWRMDDMDGLELLRFIRMSPNSPCKRVPILFLTGNTEEKQVIEARDAGVTEYMVKPFSVQQLIVRIKAIIEQPRPFIETKTYTGHDRRRRYFPPPDGVDRRKR